MVDEVDRGDVTLISKHRTGGGGSKPRTHGSDAASKGQRRYL